MNPVIPFKFKHNDKNVILKESCWLDGTPYFTRRAIGEFLEYKNPQKAIDKIIKRNPELNNPEWSVTLKLRGTDEYSYRHSHPKLGGECPPEKNQKSSRNRKITTRVYDPIGFQMIVFESRQPKAMSYKLAVARLATAYMNGEIIPYTEHYQNACSKRQLAAKRFDAIEQLPFGKKKPALTELAKEIGAGFSTVEQWQTDYRHTGTMDDKRGDVHRARITRENVPRWREIDRLLSEGHSTREAARKMGVSITQVKMVRSTYRNRYLSQPIH